jgi:hypothetical protein
MGVGANTLNNKPKRLYLPPEQELILACISLARSKEKRIYEILEGSLDWSRLFEIAAQQGIFPLIHRKLMALAETQIPPEDKIHWQKTSEDITKRNLRLTWKLVQFVELLSDHEIECVILKGPAFALQAYGDITLRQFSDLDILIHENDFPRVYDLLLQFGYIPISKLGSKQQKFHVRTDNHFSFNRQGDEFEVHWKIAPQENIHPLTQEKMWQELDSVMVYDKEIHSLSSANTILYACLHGAKHSWKQLKWIVDLAYLGQPLSEQSWLALLGQAKQKGFFRQVCLGLLLAEDLVDVVLPAGVRDLVNTDHEALFMASQVKADMFTEPEKPSQFAGYKFYFKTRERWQDRLRYLIDMIFIPKNPDWLTISLPEDLFFLYYVFRPLRLLYIIGKVALPDLF